MTEYLAENSRLRQLSRQHAEGQLSLEDYRAARREIIAALEAGQVQSAALPVAEPAPVLTADATGIRLPDDSSVFYKTMPPGAMSAEPAPETPPPAAGAWDGNTQALAIVLAVSLLTALGTLLYVFVL